MEVKNLSKSYDGRAVLSGLSHAFAPGVTVISGRSGGGKTTLLRLLMGLERPDSGEIIGVPKKMSAVFQEDRLPMDFRPGVCVSMAAPNLSREEIRERLVLLGLGDELMKPVRELSGGQRRRVAIIRAVEAGGDVLFLDEAFTGLDGEVKAAAIKYVLEKSRAKYILAVTHDEEAAALLGGGQLTIK